MGCSLLSFAIHKGCTPVTHSLVTGAQWSATTIIYTSNAVTDCLLLVVLLQLLLVVRRRSVVSYS